jgi:hypothetical protein
MFLLLLLHLQTLSLACFRFEPTEAHASLFVKVSTTNGGVEEIIPLYISCISRQRWQRANRTHMPAPSQLKTNERMSSGSIREKTKVTELLPPLFHPKMPENTSQPPFPPDEAPSSGSQQLSCQREPRTSYTPASSSASCPPIS